MGNSISEFICNPSDKKYSDDNIILSPKCLDQIMTFNLLDADHVEKEWMEKLRKKDRDHSEERCLTAEGIAELVHDIESRLDCSKFQLAERAMLSACLDANDSITKCMREMKNFINAIELVRIRRIKEALKKQRSKRPSKEILKMINRCD